MASTYLDYKIYANNMARTLQRVSAEPVVSREAQYYQNNIGSVKSVSDFVKNFNLFSYAMQAYGLQDMTYATAFMTKVLQSNLSDSSSFVNTLTDPRYKAFAEAFSFTSTGGVANSAITQSTDQEADTLGLYTQNSSLSSDSASTEAQYYKTTIGSITSVDQLTSNSRLLNIVYAAYGLNPSTTSTGDIKAALESDLSNSKSAANESGNKGLEALAADFNFAADGTVANQRLVQSQTDFHSMASAYTAAVGTDAASTAAAKTETTYVGTAIEKATSLDSLVSDPRIVAYIGQAFGVSKLDVSTLKQVLTSNVYDPTSVANTKGDAYRQIAAAFNFNSAGTVARAPATQAQSKEDISSTTTNYLNEQILTEAGAQSTGAKLALYFQQKAPSITNVYQILADSSLLTVVQTALNIPASSSSANIDVQAAAITARLKLSDLKDPTKLNGFLSQFSALYDLNNSSTSDPSSPLNLFRSSSDSSSAGILSLFQTTAASGSVLSLFASDSSSSSSSTGILSLFS